MKISKINRAEALCIALLAVFFIIGTAAGSISLATIPPQISQSSVSADTPGGNQDSDEARPEDHGTQPHKESKYALVCGIVGVRMDKATGKLVFSPPLQKDEKGNMAGGVPGSVVAGSLAGKPVTPPPLPKGEKDRVGGCILLDISKAKASRVPGELQASKLIHKVDPIYPEPAIKEHVGIGVTLRLNVNKEGLVTDAEVTKSQTAPPDRDSRGNWVGGVRPSVIKATNSAAINAVKQWKYSPTLLDGNAVPVMITATITYTFDNDGSPKIVAYAP